MIKVKANIFKIQNNKWVITLPSEYLSVNCLAFTKNKNFSIVENKLSLAFHQQNDTERVIGISSNLNIDSSKAELLKSKTPLSLIEDLNKRKFNAIHVYLRDTEVFELVMNKNIGFLYERLPNK